MGQAPRGRGGTDSERQLANGEQLAAVAEAGSVRWLQKESALVGQSFRGGPGARMFLRAQVFDAASAGPAPTELSRTEGCGMNEFPRRVERRGTAHLPVRLGGDSRVLRVGYTRATCARAIFLSL